MAVTDKVKVKQLATTIGGRMVSNWTPECSHLVMTSLTVTIKVVCALSSCKPVVTLSWLEEAVKCIHDNKMLPDTVQYQPAVVDDDVRKSGVSFAPNFSRSSLFHDRVFYFLNEKQLSALRLCLMAAGARKCVLANKPDSVAMETLMVKESIVVALKEELASTEEKKWAEQVNSYLTSHDLRVISEPEVGFALLHVSIDTYCNPRSKDGAPNVDLALPPPSLSQMPFSMHTFTQDTQHTSTQSHAHTSTHSQANVTILAPDTDLGTQQSFLSGAKPSLNFHSNDTTQSDTDIKIIEDIKMKKSKIPETPNTSRPSTSAATGIGSAKVKIEPLNKSVTKRGATKMSTNRKITDFAKPKPLRSRVASDSIVTITDDVEDDHSPGSEVKSKLSPKVQIPDSKSLDCIVDDSQPDTEQKNQPSSKKLPGLNLKRTPLQKKSSVVYQSQNEILAPQSLESNQSTQDTSILAPNSLTPSSHGKGKRSGKTPLPSASLMTELFQGGRGRKRGIESSVDAVAEEVEDGMRSRAKKIHKESEEDNKESVDGGLLGTLRNLEPQSQVENMCVEDCSSKMVDEPVSEKENDSIAISPSNQDSSQSEVRSKPLSRPAEFTQGPLATSTQAATKALVKNTKIPVSPIGGDSPFISTRKRRNSRMNETAPLLDSTLGDRSEQHTAMTFKEAANHNESLFAKTQNTQKANANKDLITPFTRLTSSSQEVAPMSIFAVTGGRRTKVAVPVQTEADNLWMEDGKNTGAEGENPLGTQYEEPAVQKYKPVLTDDGFIKARAIPKLQASRLGRFARMAKSEYLTSPGTPPPDGDEEGVANKENHTQVVCPIDFVSLVVERVERRGGGSDGEEDDEDNVEHSVLRKNFKKFRKVKNAGVDGIPQFIALKRYIPETTTTIQDWAVVDDERRRGRDDAGHDSQSQQREEEENIFDLSRISRRRK